MYFNAHAIVTINGYTLESVVSVETHNDGNHIGSYCDIVLPLNTRIEYNNDPATSPTYLNQDPQVDFSHSNQGYITAPTKYLFNTGDHIIVKAKYEGYEQMEGSGADGYLPIFEGFIYDFYESTPVKIKCLDFVYWFNLGIYGDKIKKGVSKKRIPRTGLGAGVSFKTVQFKELLQDLLDTVNYHIDTWNIENETNYPEISLIQPIFDMGLVDIQFTQMSPAAVLEWFKKELGLNITFIGNQLYVNIASFTTGEVILQTDTNVINSQLQTTNLKNFKNKTQKGSNSIFLRIRLKCNYLKATGGLKDSFEIGDENGQLKEVWFYNVKPGKMVPLPTDPTKSIPKNYLDMANEALQKFHQDRYTGEIETLLYPYCELFWKVQYFDVRYPERNGNYVITLIQQTLNENGFHRKLKLAFLDDQNG